MAYKKELSTNCKKCGVEWDEKLTNKYPKRAVCVECYRIEYAELKEKYKSKNWETKNRTEKYQPFKISNRQHIYKDVNRRIKPLKTIEEIREFTKNRFDEILEDTDLWNYINDTNIEN